MGLDELQVKHGVSVMIMDNLFENIVNVTVKGLEDNCLAFIREYDVIARQSGARCKYKVDKVG